MSHRQTAADPSDLDDDRCLDSDEDDDDDVIVQPKRLKVEKNTKTKRETSMRLQMDVLWRRSVTICSYSTPLAIALDAVANMMISDCTHFGRSRHR